MPYTPPKYPSAIPTAEDLPDRIDDVDWFFAARYNELKNELRAALLELGTLPKGAYADVKTRLDAGVSMNNPVFTGVVTAPVIALTGGQIAFPSVANPSADPNTLDDYEKGDWTPALVPATSGTITLAAGVDVGAYIKIGNLVVATAYLYVSSVSSPLGTLNLTGLPFTCGAAYKFASGAAIQIYGLNGVATTAVMGSITTNTAIISMWRFVDGTRSALAAYVQAHTDFRICVSYFIA